MKRYLPTSLAIVEMPALFEPGAGRTRMNARHNNAVKEALRRCLQYHHKYNIPKHFRFGAHAKYKYHQRSERTLLIKSRRGKRYLDLVLTGTAKAKMTSTITQLRVGGTTYGTGSVTATMTLTWPPGYYDNPRAKPGAVTKAKMRDEIERWTPQEQHDIAQQFGKFYVEEMQKQITASGRLTKRFASRLSAQGII